MKRLSNRLSTLLPLAALALSLGGCGSRGGERCLPGTVAECPCDDGSAGEMVCTSREVYGSCNCFKADGGSDGGADGGTDGGCVPQCGPRVCGPDPQCGSSCGTCSAGTCTAEGQCQTGGSGPVIQSLNSNITTMRSGDTLTLTALVTDPDGAADITGGQLLDIQNGASYGAFSGAGGGGSFTLSLTWSQIDKVRKLEVTRVFRARFLDNSGNQATADLEIAFACSSSTLTVCAGRCVDLRSDQRNCGSCGNDLLLSATPPTFNHSSPSCVNGQATCGTQYSCGEWCVKPSPTDCGACGKTCAAPANACYCVGADCAAAGCGFVNNNTTSRVSCNDYCASKGPYRCLSASYSYYDPLIDEWELDLEGCARTPPATFTNPVGDPLEFRTKDCKCVEAAGTCLAGPENTLGACTDGCSNDGDQYIDCEDRDCCSLIGADCNFYTYCGERF